MRRRQIGFQGFLLGLGLCVLLGTSAAAEHYRVKAGDSLYRIAKKFRVSPESIRRANGLEGDALNVNQSLLIPAGKSQRKVPEPAASKEENGADARVHVVKRGETLAAVSEKTGISVSEIKRLNGLKSSRLKPGQRLVLAKPGVRTPEEEDDLEEAGSVEKDDLVFLEEERGSTRPGVPVAPSRWSDPAERELFVRVVKSYEGVPYRLGGDSMRGIDCSAFTRKVYGIFRVELPRTAREQLQCGTRVGRDGLETGDLVFFQTRKYRIHVGIFLGGNEFFHLSSRNRAGKVDNIDSAYFSARFIGGVRLKETDQAAKTEAPNVSGAAPPAPPPAVPLSAGAAHSPEG